MKAIVIAGANGFIGRALTKILSKQFKIIALTRNDISRQPQQENVEWRQCDLFSLLDAEKSMNGANYAIYLVHSMMPSARLTQGNFQDTDLILADNFVRAAEKCNIEQIIYLGGIIPKEKKLSTHLESRLEVERTLSSRNVPLTALRTSIIVGPGGSSFNMMKRLVSRLPVMVCPKWTNSKTQPVAIEDVLRSFEQCIGNESVYNQQIDIGGPDIMTYQEMMQTTAKLLDKRRWICTVPVFSPRLSVLWVSLFSQLPRQLVAPLVQSLRHDMLVTHHPLVERMNLPCISFEKSVQNAIDFEQQKDNIKTPRKKSPKKKSPNRVRSIQRLLLPKGKNAHWVAETYSEWLEKALRTFIVVKTDEKGNCKFRFRFFKKSLLELTFSEERSDPDRSLFYITGGFLAKKTKRPRLEFRKVLEKHVLAAIHDYEPTLPWYIYNMSQAPVHLWIMHRFGKYLKKFAEKEKE